MDTRINSTSRLSRPLRRPASSARLRPIGYAASFSTRFCHLEVERFDILRDKAVLMARSSSRDAEALFKSLLSAYSATPSNLKIIDLYVVFAVLTAIIQVVYMAVVGSFPFNSFLSGTLSCIGTAVLAVCLRIQVNPLNKEFKDLPPQRAFADFVLCNLVLHLVIMNFLG